LNLALADTFNKELPADPKRDKSRRQVFKSCFSFVTPRVPSNPQLLHVSDTMMEAIGLAPGDQKTNDFLQVFSGTKVLSDTEPYAMCYGGHQFGHWAGQLGDGRAINLFEILPKDTRWALQLKGAGETPYSRSADGLAVLRSSIREHLCSEAMYHLGVPTTRSLSLMLTGDQVLRDVMYDGNPEYEKGAVVCRVAPSFLRFGNYQLLAARRDSETLKKLVDYTIRHFFPQFKEGRKDSYISLFREVASSTLEMIVHWQRVGFVHGVMNTDNMSILGLTIDYGPYGWLEGYDPDWTPNTTDREGRRYRFGNQPQIALWNLLQLANALYPLIEESKPFEEILTGFRDEYPIRYTKMMKQKLGLGSGNGSDNELISDLEKALQLTETDMTIFFRLLTNFNADSEIKEEHIITMVGDSFYKPSDIEGETLQSWKAWFGKYKNRLQNEELDKEQRIRMMELTNPKYVLRNYMAQMAIDKADSGDYSVIDELYTMLKNPYDEQKNSIKWFAKRPDWARHKIGCSMLSCSS
jgi:uncharacterized protein YdiU (UPF0061 family)